MTSTAIIENNSAVAQLKEKNIQNAIMLCISALQEQRHVAIALELGYLSSSNGATTEGRIDECMAYWIQTTTMRKRVLSSTKLAL